MQKTEDGKKKFISNHLSRPSKYLVKSLNKFHHAKGKSLQGLQKQDQQNNQVISQRDQVDMSNRLKHNPNFQYYFYQRYNSSKQLNKIQNSKSAKILVQNQMRKGEKLDKQIKNLQKKLEDKDYFGYRNDHNYAEPQNQGQIQMKNHQQNQKDIPFYKKYQPISIQKDPKLADYCINFPKKPFFHRKYNQNTSQQSNKKLSLSKIKQNKQNVSKYRLTRGMISPNKSKKSTSSHSKIINKLNDYGQQPILQNSSSAAQHYYLIHKHEIQPKYNLTLSPYEFQKTIQGRLKTKSARNIRMDLNKTHKISNVNKVWYNSQNDKDHEEFYKIRKSVEQENKLRKCHSFDNYSRHKLFQSKINRKKYPYEQREQGGKRNDYVPKIDEIQIYNRWKTLNHLKMEKMISRPQLPQKLGTHLEYNVYDAQKVSQNRFPKKNNNKKINNFKSERNLVWTRQVINPARGCYR